MKNRLGSIFSGIAGIRERSSDLLGGLAARSRGLVRDGSFRGRLGCGVLLEGVALAIRESLWALEAAPAAVPVGARGAALLGEALAVPGLRVVCRERTLLPGGSRGHAAAEKALLLSALLQLEDGPDCRIRWDGDLPSGSGRAADGSAAVVVSSRPVWASEGEGLAVGVVRRRAERSDSEFALSLLLPAPPGVGPGEALLVEVSGRA